MRNPLSLWQGRRYPFQDFDRALEGMFDEWPLSKGLSTNFKFTPSCEVKEDKKAYLFNFDLPGVAKDQIQLRVDGNQLSVSAERREEKKSDDEKNHFSEISYGSYSRTFTLPQRIDERLVDAKHENGVLTIRIPKEETSSTKLIDVK